MQKKIIEERLRRALLQNGEMEYGLYEYELEEHVDTWHDGLKADKDKFVFALTENTGEVAIVLITADKTVYINEDAREELVGYWPLTYRKNLEKLIPLMAEELAEGMLSVNGVKTVS